MQPAPPPPPPPAAQMELLEPTIGGIGVPARTAAGLALALQAGLIVWSQCLVVLVPRSFSNSQYPVSQVIFPFFHFS